jgi:uncharacterized protein (DUF302 family)
MAAEGLVSQKSSRSAKATLDRLAAALAEKGVTIFARVDHGGGAAAVGMSLRPTELLIFGNPKGGTPLMQEAQSAGIDLPLKALAWEDASGQAWLGYNDPAWIAQRHGLGAASAGPVKAMTALLAELARHATT